MAALKASQIGVVIPAYKEGVNICLLISEIKKHPFVSQIVVVDDSPDTISVEALKAMDIPQLSVIHRPLKGGRGSAVIEGIKFLLQKRCTFIVEMDADFSHPPEQIPELLEFAETQGIDLLIGSRYLPKSRIENWPLTRRIFSKCSNFLARRMLGIPISDYTNGYRIYSISAAVVIIETCGKLGKGFISLSEILVNVYYRGHKVAEVPTVFKNRMRGESSVNSAEITNALVGLFKIVKMKKQLLSKTLKSSLPRSI